MGTFFEEPLLRGVPIGTPEWFTRQLAIIETRPLINRTYTSWYSTMLNDAATAPSRFTHAKVLEIGSGAGFVRRIDPTVITSDVIPGISDMLVDAQHLPFDDESLRAILLTHVFHHIPDVSLFLNEATRTLVPGGVITMIDVAHTALAKLIFGHFHPEDFDTTVSSWNLDASRPIGGANQAMSWVVFVRDKLLLRERYPNLEIECIEFLPWLGYLFSGGVTRKSFVPSCATNAVGKLEQILHGTNSICSLHWHIRIRKRDRLCDDRVVSPKK